MPRGMRIMPEAERLNMLGGMASSLYEAVCAVKLNWCRSVRQTHMSSTASNVSPILEKCVVFITRMQHCNLVLDAEQNYNGHAEMLQKGEKDVERKIQVKAPDAEIPACLSLGS